MTTVVVDIKRMAMAADTRCTSSDGNFATKKIYCAKDGTLIGYSGNVCDAILFVEWYQAGAKRNNPPEFSEKLSFTALTLNKNGCTTWDSNCIPMPMDSTHYAIGSGSFAAMAAIHLGCSIEQAIEVAAIVDSSSTGLPLRVELYKEIKKKPKSKASKKTIKEI